MVLYADGSLESLPLMRKTFIEAKVGDGGQKIGAVVSSAYAEDFH